MQTSLHSQTGHHIFVDDNHNFWFCTSIWTYTVEPAITIHTAQYQYLHIDFWANRLSEHDEEKYVHAEHHIYRWS